MDVDNTNLTWGIRRVGARGGVYGGWGGVAVGSVGSVLIALGLVGITTAL